MQLLKELRRCEGLTFEGRTDCREAVRAIVLRGQKVLMVYSRVNADYKFPGGGVETGERHWQTLRRELAEESGAVLSRVLSSFGKVVEYDCSQHPRRYDLFCMTSYYYLCRVLPALRETRLDAYERRLEFAPVWVDVTEAICANQQRLSHPRPPFWTSRETYVLQQVQEWLSREN
jgi:8-oxo-dGTP diphosphatase